MNPPHIARHIRYPDFVTSVEAHTSQDNRYRDYLRLRCGWQPGVNHRRIGIFIGANPSAANGAGSDLTINKVLRTFCGEFACNDVYILNLSPLRATLAAEAVATLNDPEAIAESIDRNPAAMTLLHEAIKEGVFLPVIWPAWGDCLKRHTRTLSAPFKAILEGREVLHLPLLKNGEPGHPCRADLKQLGMSVLWPKVKFPSCTLCGADLPAADPAQHLECRVWSDRLGLPHDDRAGFESSLIAASEGDIRRALDGYRIAPLLERRALLLPYTDEDIPF